MDGSPTLASWAKYGPTHRSHLPLSKRWALFAILWVDLLLDLCSLSRYRCLTCRPKTTTLMLPHLICQSRYLSIHATTFQNYQWNFNYKYGQQLQSRNRVTDRESFPWRRHLIVSQSRCKTSTRYTRWPVSDDPSLSFFKSAKTREKQPNESMFSYQQMSPPKEAKEGWCTPTRYTTLCSSRKVLLTIHCFVQRLALNSIILGNQDTLDRNPHDYSSSIWPTFDTLPLIGIYGGPFKDPITFHCNGPVFSRLCLKFSLFYQLNARWKYLSSFGASLPVRWEVKVRP